MFLRRDEIFYPKDFNDRNTFKNRTSCDPKEISFVSFMPPPIAFGNIEGYGEGEIRTREGLTTLSVFKRGACLSEFKALALLLG
jgi:hypothetical protein